MKDHQKAKTEQTFLVLVDFSEASYRALKYAITLAKKNSAGIEVFYVGQPSMIVKSDNQLVALRAIESETRKTEDKLKAIVEIITTEDIPASYQYSFGNMITELDKHIGHINPDLVVVGKKGTGFSGILASFLLYKYAGSLLIVSKDGEFHDKTKISLAYTDKTLNKYNPNLVFELDRHTEAPLTLLTFNRPTESGKSTDASAGWQAFNGKDGNFQYDNQQNPKVTQGLVKYVSEKKIDLLCLGRGKQRNYFQNLMAGQGNITSEVIKRLDIPVLVMGINSK